jgi:nitrogen fixation/metabolism regulation signal transduction histidine kinase
VPAFYFFHWTQAAPGFAIAGVGYAIALLHHDDADDRFIYWFMGVGTLIVTRPGLAPGDENLIFEPFYHGRDEGPGHHGPGLGLAIARGFIETNGGRIRAESRPAGARHS